jgi:predicted phosphate transport protein (TIGR00153 family)
MGIYIHKKEKHIVENIKKHVELVNETVQEFVRAINCCMDGDIEKTNYYTKLIHKREKEADHYLREINKEMFEGAFMPSVREVLFIALDFVDKVANEAEKGGDFLSLIEPGIPEMIKDNVRKMSKLTGLCSEKLKDAVNNLFENAKVVFEDTKEIEHLEGEVDKYIWKSIEAVFKKIDGLKFSEKMMLRELILRVNSITNRMEDASDRLDLVVLKLRT